MEYKETLENIIKFQEVSKYYFHQKIYENVNIEINKGDKSVIFGINGAGKSTLLKLINDEEQPTKGEVYVNPKYKIAIFNQFEKIDPTLTVQDLLNRPFEKLIFLQKEMERIGSLFNDNVAHNESLMDKYGQLTDEFEALGGYSYLHIQSEFANIFEFSDKLEKTFDILSGGEKQYIRLALTLFMESDLIILDEPLSFFDKKKTAWLLNYLKTTPKGVLLICHNIDFVRALVNKVFDISNYKVNEYTGNYNEFLKARKIFIAEEKKNNKKKEELIDTINKAISRKENLMERTENKRGHAVILRRLEKELEKLGESITEFAPEYKYNYTPIPQEAFISHREIENPLITLENISKNYKDKSLYNGVNLVINKNDKICIVGENGSGKSTLLKILTGEISPSTGNLYYNPKLKISCVEQEIHFKNTDITIIEYLKEKTGLSYEFLEAGIDLLYNNEEFKEKKLSFLSGGEAKRLEIFLKTLEDSDILIIDEPTTFMDDYSRDVIAKMLLDYQGALIIVTHDKWLIKKIGFETYDIRDGLFRKK